LGLSAFLSVGILAYFIGAGLEMGKLSSIIYIHRNWTSSKKYFYIFIVGAIALLTTFEVFGYLSFNHVVSTHVSKSSENEIKSLAERKIFLKDQIEKVEDSLKELPDGYVKRKEIARNKPEYKKNISEIDKIIKRETALSTNKETAVAGGATFATAQLLDVKPETVARSFNLILVLVWEILSTGMIVMFSSVWQVEKKFNPLPISNNGRKALKPRNRELIILAKKNKWTLLEIASFTGKQRPETVKDWLNNKTEIPIRALNILKLRERNGLVNNQINQ
ncbi:MAG: DUF5320 domain-containing protein, partial [Deltaproteobacteria bacterium]|nr:DUF5320 domain-containing protein [Deltaproteobacteria bacterium]